MQVIVGLAVFLLAATLAGMLPSDLRLYAYATIMMVLAVMVLVLYASTERLKKEVSDLNIQLEFERKERPE